MNIIWNSNVSFTGSQTRPFLSLSSATVFALQWELPSYIEDKTSWKAGILSSWFFMEKAWQPLVLGNADRYQALPTPDSSPAWDVWGPTLALGGSRVSAHIFLNTHGLPAPRFPGPRQQFPTFESEPDFLSSALEVPLLSLVEDHSQCTAPWDICGILMVWSI